MECQQIISVLLVIGLVSLIVRSFLNRNIRTTKLIRYWRILSDIFHDHQFLQFPEFNNNSQINPLFHRVDLYLNSLESLQHSDNTNLFSEKNPNDIILSLNANQTILDTFLGARIWWTSRDTSTRSFTLKIRTRDKKRVLRSYLQHINLVSDEIIENNRELRLFITNSTSTWREWVPFTHPATLDTIVIKPEVKEKVKLDVETFLKSRQYYNRLGRVWRRSYLLYGPSGTGKSSFAAALARTLSYDMYDLYVSSPSDLKLLLLQTTPRSVILIEDFDKYLSGKESADVMSFMDGVVSSCCEERVIVFTMMSKDGIDPVIIRPGRVDVHIHFPMCDFSSFKDLACNYLSVKEHKLFPQVEEILSSGAKISPAEVCELLLVNRNSPSRAIKSVITALQSMPCSNLVGVGLGESESCRVMGTPKDRYRSGRGSVDGARHSIDGAKEFRKLYSLLRRKSSLNKSNSFDLGT